MSSVKYTRTVWRLRTGTGLSGIAALLVTGLLSSSCGPSPAVREFRQKIAQTKQKCRAAEVRQAVLTLRDRWGRDSGYIAIDEWPQVVQDVALFPKYVDGLYAWTFECSSGQEALGLIAGGGFGHWGIIVCIDSNSVPKIRSTALVPWEAGVYFWLE